jgi:hypothetical protein
MVALLVFAPAVGATSYRSDALIIQGHSPVVMLVTDPNGKQIGCTDWTTAHPCNSDTSYYFVNTIPTPPEGPATYNFASNLINIPHPAIGVFTVEFFGTGTGSYTITAASCNLIVCYNVILAHGTITQTEVGKQIGGPITFTLTTNGQVFACNPIVCTV